MCGRYQLEYGMNQLMLLFDAQNRYVGYGAKFEIFPTDIVAIVTREDKQNFIDPAKWGLKNFYDNRPLINARGETIDEKKTFKSMFAQGRCIIPASAFFEWRKNPDGTKTKIQISLNNSPLFGMAGLYKAEQDENGTIINRCTIITTSANSAMGAIHDRMPVILPSDLTEVWLDNNICDSIMLKELLKPYDGSLEMTIVA
ncbi:MAG: response-associated peptidase [Clostridia bacterium]|jgi:putative SOS response-associated peptidase YedK|nr:response-associated peptidase [Clostridia bacterium]